MKEILKIQCQIYILMKKMIILRKIQFEPEQKKTCGNEGYEKETKHIHVRAGNSLHIRIGNLDWYKCRHCKNEGSKVDFLCCREEDAMLLTAAKIPQGEGRISPCSFFGQLPD